MKKFKLYSLVLVLFLTAKIQAQVQTDSSKTFTNIEEALKNPDEVISLDLSNQTINLSDSAWKRFGNLEFLSLKDEHLKEVPHGLVYLNKLKILDLSGNDIKELPSFMRKMKNLEEVYLNDETNLDVNQSLLCLLSYLSLKRCIWKTIILLTFPQRFSNLKILRICI